MICLCRNLLLLANWSNLSYLDESNIWRMYYESCLVHFNYLTEQFGWQNDYHLFDGQNEFVNIHKNRKSVKQKMKKCRNKHFVFIIHSKVIFGRYYWHINIFSITVIKPAEQIYTTLKIKLNHCMPMFLS